MITIEVPKKQTVTLEFDSTHTYPIIRFSEDGVDVCKLILFRTVAAQVAALLLEATRQLEHATP